MCSLPSPHRIAGERLINKLTNAMSDYEATASFSCGGYIGIHEYWDTTRYGDFTSTRKPVTSPAIDIRWDASDGNVSRKITFPVSNGKEEVLEQLVKDCKPATFGLYDKNVLDETIRKAGKLESNEFSTSFNPYDFGIVDEIVQALLPSIGKASHTERWGVVAELYKLNVYSGPSGKFKSHVDTPRGFTQFGSLVVCLPNPHEGGQLRVAHKGAERLFDLRSTHKILDRSFSGGNGVFCDSCIHWAAFYSDCEHEVLPVTSGHRVTLTYQLYVSEDAGGLRHPQFPPIDQRLSSLYYSIKEMLSLPTFLKNGGILGFHCAHQYPNSEVGTYFYPRLPHALKGIDAVLFTIFRSLGLAVRIWPVSEGRVSKEDSDATPRFRDLIIIEEETEGDLKAGRVTPRFYGSDTFENVIWFNESADHRIGTAYHEVAGPITQWIGNEVEIDWWYSLLALLVEIPTGPERKLEG
ncbi:hypothetical protein V8E51_014137 [Hyaloscypha variabilis]